MAFYWPHIVSDLGKKQSILEEPLNFSLASKEKDGKTQITVLTEQATVRL